jgi:hypothetical protein
MTQMARREDVLSEVVRMLDLEQNRGTTVGDLVSHLESRLS